MPEPSVAAVALDYGGAAAVAPQPPAAGQHHQARPENEADWAPAVGRRCKARWHASTTNAAYLHQRKWFPGVITAVDVAARTCDVASIAS